MFPKATDASAPTAGQPGTPGTAPAAQTVTTQDGAPTNTTPKFVTQEELIAAVEAARRDAQSLVSKQETRITKAIEALKKQGVTAPTREMAVALLDATDTKPADPAPAPAAPAAPVQTQPPAQAPAAPVQPPQLTAEQTQATTWMQEDGAPANPFTAQGYLMMVKAGVRIQEGDPELESIKTDGEGYEFLTTLAAAIEAKKQRTIAAGGQSRAPGGVSGAPVTAPKSTLDLLTLAYSKPK